ncbi:MAG: FAD-dependent oxidoreductase [Candidatus Vogelbacteria bacterium]|nr:FAD-dependent oxidoreductase [Candidatus Vogelbacteria bacterium]
MENIYDVVIVGSGAAGLSAAIYAGRYQMKTLIVAGDFGGETAKAGVIWNYPGAKGVDGYELMKTMKEQAMDVGVQFEKGWVTNVIKENDIFKITFGTKTVESRSVILSGGAERKRLGIQNEKELSNKGIHYCVTCDGPLFMGKTVAMVGGGDAALKGVLLLGEYAEKIYMIVRSHLRGEPVNIEAVKKLGSKVQILEESKIKEIVGVNKLEKIVLDKAVEGISEIVLDGLFVEIGAEPKTEIAKSLGVELDETGYVNSTACMVTSAKGVFVAGDTANVFGHFKQIVTATAMGALAATSAYEYLKEN